MVKILCAGMVTLDFLNVIDTYPTENTENAIKRSAVAIGGPIGRAAVCCSRLGAHTYMASMTGPGIFADMLRAELLNEAIDLRFVVEPTCAISQHSFIVISDYGKCRTTFWVPQPSANSELTNLSHTLVHDVDVVLLDCTDPGLSLKLAKAASEASIPSIIDTGSYKPYVEDILPYIDHIVSPEKFFVKRASLRNSNPEHQLRAVLNEYQAKSVIMTRGENGGLFVAAETAAVQHYPALMIEPLDTCGAGDTFHGAFAYAVGQKWSIQDTVLFSSWAAGRKCAGLGNETLPGQDDLNQWRHEMARYAQGLSRI